MEKSTKHSSRKFSITEALKFGWEFFKKNLVTFLKLGGVLFLINIATNILTGILKGGPLSLIWALASFVVSLLVQIGSIKIVLELHEGKPLNLSHLYSQSGLLLRYLGASILYGAMVVIGLIFLIVPGIYLAIRYQFYSFLIVDKNIGIFDSFEKSSKMTEGVKWQLFLLGLVLVVINIIGAIPFFLGLIVTIPVSVMSTVYVYKKLQ